MRALLRRLRLLCRRLGSFEVADDAHPIQQAAAALNGCDARACCIIVVRHTGPGHAFTTAIYGNRFYALPTILDQVVLDTIALDRRGRGTERTQ